MAAGSVTVAALRHRPRRAALVVLLSAVVTGVAVLGPFYSPAVEQSVLRTAVGAAPVAQSGIVVFAMGSPPPSPAKLFGAPDPDAVSLRATVVGIYEPVDRGHELHLDGRRCDLGAPTMSPRPRSRTRSGRDG